MTIATRRFPAAVLAISLASVALGAGTAHASCSQEVRSLQQRLADLGYPAGGVDGCAGPGTTAAVVAFQRTQGLAADGVAGRATKRALSDPRTVVPISRGRGARVEVDLQRQLLLRVRRGRVIATYAASTGSPGHATPSGRFRVGRKEVRSWSVPYSVWLPWASYFNAGIAVHAGDVSRPWASHGCVRVPAAVASELYAAMPAGTRVVVR